MQNVALTTASNMQKKLAEAGVASQILYSARNVGERAVSPVMHFNNGNLSKSSYGFEVSGFAVCDDSFVSSFGYALAAGRLPQTATEVAISSLCLEIYKIAGYYVDETQTINIASAADLIGKTIEI